MNYISSQTLVLRQITAGFAADGGKVSAILKCDRQKKLTAFCIMPVNLAPVTQGNYALVLRQADGELCDFTMAQSPQKQTFEKFFFSLNDGFAAAIVYRKGSTVLPVAFASSLTSPIKISELTKFYAEKGTQQMDYGETQTPFGCLDGDGADLGLERADCYYDPADEAGNHVTLAAEGEHIADGEKDGGEKDGGAIYQRQIAAEQRQIAAERPCDAYDDEAVASENYFNKERSDLIDRPQRLGRESSSPDGTVNAECERTGAECEQRTEECRQELNAPPINDQKECLDAALFNKACDFKQQNNDKQQAQENCDATYRYEEQACACKGKTQRFYLKIERDINALFEKYHDFCPLAAVIPQSKWVKISYGSGHYVVGVISEDGAVKYIAYGVPGLKDSKPVGFENYSVFIPESLFDPEGNGYWCMLQSAEDGSTARP